MNGVVNVLVTRLVPSRDSPGAQLQQPNHSTFANNWVCAMVMTTRKKLIKVEVVSDVM